MDKTIPQIANEIGVSRQAVWYKIKNKKFAEEIKKHSHRMGKKFFIDELGVQIIKNAFAQDMCNTKTNDRDDTTQSQSTIENYDINFENNKHVFNVLSSQLTAMNKHNEELIREINQLSKELSKEREHSRILADKLAELATNAQKLHAGDIVVPRLENKSEEENETKHKNIFGMLFRRKK